MSNPVKTIYEFVVGGKVRRKTNRHFAIQDSIAEFWLRKDRR
jgi:hypothetical protein